MESSGSKEKVATLHCDIFCDVIDNFGDIGVSWRLARQLAMEHGCRVRLWIDELVGLSNLCPDVDPSLGTQCCRGVEVRHWASDVINVVPAELVIGAFGCVLPKSYVEAMALQMPQPVWVNLEYLSAEDWVAGCHGLPSPHPRLPLTKYFFFPGFTKQTGGLLLERDLLVRRELFQRDVSLQQAFWQSIGMEMPSAETLKVSLFAYENTALDGLFDVWVSGAQPVLCLVPEGRILPQVGQNFGDDSPCVGKTYSRGNLQVRVLPFVEQQRYDELLWACDINFVRGEDSCVRAQWAMKPFIWQIYPQHDAVHLKKLDAFLTLYGEQLSRSASQAIRDLWQAWNAGSGAGAVWPAFMVVRGELERHAQHWAWQLAENNLALNLLDFFKEIGRIRAFENEGQ